MSVSVIIPCLNEEGSIEECVRRARDAFKDEPQCEILVLDNGSTDQSRNLALAAGAKVIQEPRRGYGSAILRGLKEASGDFLVIGDADNTYDYRDGRRLVQLLEEGAEFAIGDRLHGEMEKGAMPWLHRTVGTPTLTWILNKFFGSNVKDINCGLRALRRSALDRLKLRSPGMEFASEMVIHAQKAGLKFAETPIRYYRRSKGEAKLRTFRDGWRHLRFILLCAPSALFILPAIVLALISFRFTLSDRLGFQVLGGSLLALASQIFIFGILAKSYLWVVDSFLVDLRYGKIVNRFKLEYGIILSLVLALIGVLLVQDLSLSGLIRGGWLMGLSVQMFFSSFLLSIILMKKREDDVRL